MNSDFIDPRTAAMAALTAVTLCDAMGLTDALANLPPIEAYSGDNDVDADQALFSGSGVAS